MVWDPKDFISNGHEVDKCRPRLQKFCKGVGTDVGCGSIIEEKGYPRENKIVPHAIGCDKAYTNLSGYADNLEWWKDGVLDFVFSSHLLEHIDNYAECLHEWWRVLKLGGYLVLYLPHKHYYPNVGDGRGNPDHKHDFTPLGLLEIIIEMKFKFNIEHIEVHNEANEYSFDFVIRKGM